MRRRRPGRLFRLRPLPLPLALALALGAALSATGTLGQQPAVFYVYDDLNRLVGVIDQDGNAATYVYDAVGNILRIDRLDATGTSIAITHVTPARGKVGTPVQIFGKGFSATAAQNSLTFNGTRADVTSATPNRLVTSVPAGAVTGPITVTSPLGTATSAVAFRVPGAIAVSPATLTIFARRTQSFTASEVGNASAAVSWSVDGVASGNPTVGTISTEGLYTAPALVPSPPTVTVAATNTEDTGLSATATVTIVTPPDILLVASPVTVQTASPIVSDRNVGAAVSVQVDSPLAPDKNVTASLSVHVGVAAAATAGAGITVNVGPVITSVSPATGVRGQTAIALRIEGAELANASALTFRLNNAADPTITVIDFVIDPDAGGADVTIAIAPGAPLGSRVIQVVTPTAASTPIGTTGNRFTVQ